MYQTQIILIKKSHPLYDYCDKNCKLAKNIKNATIFRLRQLQSAKKKNFENLSDHEKEVLKEFEDSGTNDGKYNLISESYTFPTKFHLDYVFRQAKNVDYFNDLPMQSTQQVVGEVYESFKAWLAALKEYSINPSKFNGLPKMPNYIKADKIGFSIPGQNARISKKGINIPNSKAKLSVGNLSLGKIKEIQIIPFYDIFKICIIHDVEFKPFDLDKTRILGIDLGIDNFLTTSNNCGLAPFIINGKVIKSCNQYFNKKMGEIQARLAEKNLYTSKALSQLWRKRNNYFHNMEHQISHFVCNYCVANNIGTIVIGKNDNWKQNINIGKKNNQTFCFIPHAHFIEVLKNKALKYGIDVMEVEESYTSKASFLDMDVIPIYKKSKNSEDNKDENNNDVIEDNNIYKFSGSRIHRGLYKTNNGILINADVNGASNIIRKAFPDAFSNVIDFNYLIKTVNKYTLGKTTKKSENREIQKLSRIKRKAG